MCLQVPHPLTKTPLSNTCLVPCNIYLELGRLVWPDHGRIHDLSSKTNFSKRFRDLHLDML